MKIIQFEGCNVTLPQLGDKPAMMVKEGNVTCFVLAFQPSKDDIEMIKKGQPIYLQMYREVPVSMIYTVNKEGMPNV